MTKIGGFTETKFGPVEPPFNDLIKHVKHILKGKTMHYRNGREAKNGDKIIQIAGYGDGALVAAVGVLYDAKPGNDHCNGYIAPTQPPLISACLCDCLHVDDISDMLREKGLDKRPPGK